METNYVNKPGIQACKLGGQHKTRNSASGNNDQKHMSDISFQRARKALQEEDDIGYTGKKSKESNNTPP